MKLHATKKLSDYHLSPQDRLASSQVMLDWFLLWSARHYSSHWQTFPCRTLWNELQIVLNPFSDNLGRVSTLDEHYWALSRSGAESIQDHNKVISRLNAYVTLQIAIKVVNDSIDPNGISPTFAVIGCILRLGLLRDRPSPSTFQRVITMKKATTALTKYFASRQIQDALQTRNDPSVTDILSAPIGSHALVYCIEKFRCEGSSTILFIERDDVYLLLSDGPAMFRFTVMKPCVSPEKSNPIIDATGSKADSTKSKKSRKTEHFLSLTIETKILKWLPLKVWLPFQFCMSRSAKNSNPTNKLNVSQNQTTIKHLGTFETRKYSVY